MRQLVDTALMREIAPQAWNNVWRIIKTDAPQLAAFMRDPLLGELIDRFDATVQLPLRDMPPDAVALIPRDVIITVD